MHERYTIEVNFTVCEGLRDKALEEIRTLLNYIQQNSLDHASDIKTYVRHEPIIEKIEEPKEIEDGTTSERPS